MQCDICRRSSREGLAFHCTICARNAVYETRIHIAQALLENEAAGAAVGRNIGARKPVVSHSKSSSHPKSREISTVWAMQRAQIDQAASKEKTEHILSHVEALRNETVAMKAEMARRKAMLVQRKVDLKSAAEALAAREAAALEPLERGIRRMEHRWDAMHAKTVESRVFLCREAAQLYGLQQRKTKKAMAGSASFFIGGMPIADLRDLDSEAAFPLSWFRANAYKMPRQSKSPHQPHILLISFTLCPITSPSVSRPKLPSPTAIILYLPFSLRAPRTLFGTCHIQAPRHLIHRAIAPPPRVRWTSGPPPDRGPCIYIENSPFWRKRIRPPTVYLWRVSLCSHGILHGSVRLKVYPSAPLRGKIYARWARTSGNS
jgi:hypothetical protein